MNEQVNERAVDEQLHRLAQAHCVASSYKDWRERETPVPRETLVAVLAALGVDASTPGAVRDELARLEEQRRQRLLPPVVACRRVPGADQIRVPSQTEVSVELADGTTLTPPSASPTAEGHLAYALPSETPLGWHRVRARRGSHEQDAALLVAPDRLRTPERVWGFTAQLYSVRSRASWGMGDLHDLAQLAAWSGRELDAGFVLVNPLHATEPTPPINPSPYSPMSRRFASPLYLRVEDVPEYRELSADDRERIAALAAPLRQDERLIDRDAVWTAKRQALETLYRVPRTPARQQAYESFRQREGTALTAFATWCALAEEHGNDWRRWPSALRDADSPAVAREAERLAPCVDFHAWLQWQLDEQLTAVQRTATASGMPIGIMHDLAVGVTHSSADAWVYRDVFAEGMSVGAPPDEFNQRGQDWGQPPWHPQRLAQAEYARYRDMLAASLRRGGGLRIDHAMQVSRLWWVPEGGSPADGTYVGYDRNALLSCLTWEAARADAVIVGEDLGTVEPQVREDLAERGVLGTSLLWFERDRAGRPKPPGQWRELSLATVGTHDMPPITGFLHGDHVALRDRLGLLTRPAADEAADHRRLLAGWLALLHAEGLLADPPDALLSAVARGAHDHDEAAAAALHALLARTPARLIGVSLADAVGERRTQNQPGTSDEYPNWRVPLAGADGRPVPLDDLPADPRVAAAVAPVRAATRTRA
ncbi:4-alpha-glucanotransferase [Actinomadura sp. NPDC047616]|uniref:4-alpha-glucanotransferase n=1 Tax=Actinomadura sp. NPDC047616 TaxID=3155914 RepID=UPI0033D825E4